MKRRTFQYASFAIILLALTASAHAQQKLQLKIGYNVSTPVGKFTDVVSKTSFSGLAGELMYPLNDRLQVGVGASFNDYYQKYGRQTYSTNEGTISAVLTNSVQITPVLAKVNYNLTTQGLIRPYAGLGAGMGVISFKQYLGEFPESKASVKPDVSGDAGVNIALGKTKTAGVNLGANFNYLPFHYNGIQNLNSWGIHAGLFFTLH